MSMPQPTTTRSRLGLAALALLLFVPVLTLWNLAAQSFAPKLVVMIGPRLRGVTLERMEGTVTSDADAAAVRAEIRRARRALRRLG